MRRMGREGMVASPHYLATGAGVHVLRRGGSAVDAAIATNAVLAVVTPYMCGIGGDLFAQVYTSADNHLVGLNGSGRAPGEATVERMRELAGTPGMPARGPLPITVPGCIDAWGHLHERFGRLPWRELLSDAINYATKGFPVTDEFSRSIAASADFLHPDTPARETFLPDGVAPAEGHLFMQPRLARTLQIIADEGPDVYYRGIIGQEIVRAVRAIGGLLSEDDLSEHYADWVDPLSVQYRDVTVYELPPNSQGITALLMLNVLQQLPARPLQEGGADYVHLLAETARLAYADREAHLTDPEHMSIAPEELLSEAYARRRVSLLQDRAVAASAPGSPGDTIYLCTADEDGNCVSLIESNFSGIGSGVMAGETGIMLQNRGHWFSLDAGHRNVIAPRKRTLHTLMPAMAFRDGRPWLVFGTMGGSAQAQLHVEILTRIVDQGLPIHEALDAPRFDAVVGEMDSGLPALEMESRFPKEVMESLLERGHGIRYLDPYTSAMGHAHIIEFLDNGAYAGASDPRTNGLALGY